MIDVAHYPEKHVWRQVSVKFNNKLLVMFNDEILPRKDTYCDNIDSCFKLTDLCTDTAYTVQNDTKTIIQGL